MNRHPGLWIPISTADVDLEQVQHIDADVHPGLPERMEVFAEKIRLFPRGCLKLMRGEAMVGYGVSHPWRLFSVPSLDCLLGALPDKPDCLHVHDVAVLPEARGRGASEQYIAEMRAIARDIDIPKLACVSVYGTTVLWQRYGFRTVSTDEIAAKLKCYGDTARYMIAEA